MNLIIGICDDNKSHVQYIKNLVSCWSIKTATAIQIKEFSSGENFLFQYEDYKNFDIFATR